MYFFAVCLTTPRFSHRRGVSQTNSFDCLFGQALRSCFHVHLNSQTPSEHRSHLLGQPVVYYESMTLAIDHVWLDNITYHDAQGQLHAEVILFFFRVHLLRILISSRVSTQRRESRTQLQLILVCIRARLRLRWASMANVIVQRSASLPLRGKGSSGTWKICCAVLVDRRGNALENMTQAETSRTWVLALKSDALGGRSLRFMFFCRGVDV